MRKSALFLVLLLSSLLGCVPVDSLSPLYTERNVIFEPALIGTWVGEDRDKGSLRFEKEDGDGYQMVSVEKKDGFMQETVYEAHLVSLGGEKYLDISPKELDLSSEQLTLHLTHSKKNVSIEPGLASITSGLFMETSPGPNKGATHDVQLRFRAAHWIFKVAVDNDQLTLAYLDDEWIKEAAEKKELRIPHMRAGEHKRLALTGSTAELQQFIVQQADREGAFSNLSTLKKGKPPENDSEKSGSQASFSRCTTD